MKLQVFLFLFVLLVSSCGNSALDQGGLSQQEIANIHAFFKAHDESILSADWAKVALQYTEDAIRFPPGGDPIEGRIAIQDGLEVVDRYIEFAPETIEIEGQGNIAYALANFTATFVLAGSSDPLSVSGTSIAILKKQDDNSWKLFRVIWN